MRERERERERGREGEGERKNKERQRKCEKNREGKRCTFYLFVCFTENERMKKVFKQIVCVGEKESMCVCVCVHVRV